MSHALVTVHRRPRQEAGEKCGLILHGGADTFSLAPLSSSTTEVGGSEFRFPSLRQRHRTHIPLHLPAEPLPLRPSLSGG